MGDRQLPAFAPLGTGQVDDVAHVLADAFGGLPDQRIERARSLIVDSETFVLTIDGTPVAAAAGRRSGFNWLIHAIGVAEQERMQGLGRLLIAMLTREFPNLRLEAETDTEGAGFYQRVGFGLTSLGEKWPGVERFHCLR